MLSFQPASSLFVNHREISSYRDQHASHVLDTAPFFERTVFTPVAAELHCKDNIISDIAVDKLNSARSTSIDYNYDERRNPSNSKPPQSVSFNSRDDVDDQRLVEEDEARIRNSSCYSSNVSHVKDELRKRNSSEPELFSEVSRRDHGLNLKITSVDDIVNNERKKKPSSGFEKSNTLKTRLNQDVRKEQGYSGGRKGARIINSSTSNKTISNDNYCTDDVDTTNIDKKKESHVDEIHNLTCMYTNADGIVNKRRELEANIEIIKPDIIAITEVYPKNVASEIEKSELELDSYDCFLKPGGRGVCIYIKKKFKAIPVTDLSSNDFQESIWCELRLKNNDKLLIGCVYRSPNSTANNNLMLYNLINEAGSRSNSHLFIMGDFNYPEIDWSSFSSKEGVSHHSWQFLECLQDNFLFQKVDCNTRFREGQNPSLLDLVLVNEDGMVSDIEARSPLGKSDHVVLYFKLHCYVDSEDVLQQERFLYNKGDYEKLSEDLSAVNWDDELENLNANDSWKVFADRLNDAIDRNIPKTKPKNDNLAGKKSKPLWMNKDAMQKVKKKYHAWKRYTNTKQYCDYQLYCKARNTATSEVRKAKRLFEQKLASEIKDNPKSFWKYVRAKTKVKQGVSDLLKEDGSYAHSDSDKAEELNKFFASVFTMESDTDIPDPEPKHQGDNFSSMEVTKEEVMKKLRELNPTKSPGPDGIHPKVLRETANVIAYPLSLVFNKSLSEGVVPEEWKIANVTAIFKKGNVTSAGNYRPVSLTSIVCKLLESLIRDQVMKFLDDNNLLSNDQHGFRSGRSCVTQLLEIMETWTSLLEDGGGIDVVYLDFRKAFDSVPHQRLLRKVKAHGIDGDLLKWVESFLTGRKQRVNIHGKFSSWADVHSGIPQGSVLGPILFVIFINDLPDAVGSYVKIFADDTKVFTQIKKEDDWMQLQDDLDSLSHWSDMWQLKFNVSKCGVMHYGSQTEVHTYSMSEEGTRRNLEVLNEEKDLGVKFDPTLTFSKHAAMVANKANRIVGVIRRTFDFLDEEIMKLLYKSLVRPHLEYANCIWNPVHNKDIQLIEKVQRRATKSIPSLKELPYQDRLRRLGLPTLAYRRLRGDLIQVYKIMHGLNDIDKEKLFHMADQETGTRGHPYKIHKQHTRLQLRKHSFSIRIVNSWNRLPDTVVSAPTMNQFKNGVDEALARVHDKFTYGVGNLWLTNLQ